LAAAYAHELPRYGIKVGLTNYAACYATGLLLARRVNSKFGLPYDSDITTKVPEDQDRAPFKALLDVGLYRTTTGSRVFAALKGAVDGGLNIPHNTRRFPGTVKEGKELKANADVTRKYIFGGHVAGYMKSLKELDAEAFARQFARYIKLNITADKLEAIYKKAHTDIRADPNRKRSPLERGSFKTREKAKQEGFQYKKQKFQAQPVSRAQAKARIRSKLLAANIQELEDWF